MNKFVIAAIVVVVIAGFMFLPTQPSNKMTIFLTVTDIGGQPTVTSLTYLVTPSTSPLIGQPQLSWTNIPLAKVTTTANMTDPLVTLRIVEEGAGITSPISEPVSTNEFTTQISTNTGLPMGTSTTSTSSQQPSTSTTITATFNGAKFNVVYNLTASAVDEATGLSNSTSIPMASPPAEGGVTVSEYQSAAPTFVSSVSQMTNPSQWYVVSTNGGWSGATGAIAWGSDYPNGLELSLTPIHACPSSIGGSMTGYYMSGSTLNTFSITNNVLINAHYYANLAGEQNEQLGPFYGSHPGDFA
ncbi:MAG: hypothetical protein JRN66_07810 [Nitrososphaerota archaeon]|nr:hypothetical protein [Nitrososphaerota archaeon]